MTVTAAAQPTAADAKTKKGLFGRMKAKLSSKPKEDGCAAAAPAPAGSAGAGAVPAAVAPATTATSPVKSCPESVTPEKVVSPAARTPAKQQPRAAALQQQEQQEQQEGLDATHTSPLRELRDQANCKTTAGFEEQQSTLIEACEVLGAETKALLLSEAWKDRKGGLEVLSESIAARRAQLAEGQRAEGVAAQLAATLVVARHCLLDSVGPVNFAALDMLAAAAKVLPAAVLKEEWAAEGVKGAPALDAIVPVLLLKMNDTNKRMQRDACRCLMKIAGAREVRGLKHMMPFLAHAEVNGATLPLRPRLAVLRLLIADQGFEKGKLNLTLCMGVALPALAIAEDKTRKAAVAVMVAAHVKAGGKRVARHLRGVKPAMLTILQRKFAEADAENGVVGEGGAGGAAGGASALGGSGVLKPLAKKASSSSLRPIGGGLGPLGGGLAASKPLGSVGKPTIEAGGAASGVDSKYAFKGNYGCGGNAADGAASPMARPNRPNRPAAAEAGAGAGPSFDSKVFEDGDDALMDSILAEGL